MENMITEVYRYELFHNYEESGIYVKTLKVIKETPCGYWIDIGRRRKKWISKNARNSYAQITKREALKHFVRRKMYRNHCIMEEIERNDAALRLAKETIKKGDDEQRKTGITERSYIISKTTRVR